MAIDPKDPKLFNLTPGSSDLERLEQRRTGRRLFNPDIARLSELSESDARTIINHLEADIARLTADGRFDLVQKLRLRRDYISLLNTQLTAHKEEVSIIQKMLDEAIAEERRDRELGEGRFESQASARVADLTYRQLSGGYAALTADGGAAFLSTAAWANYTSFAQIQAEATARYWDGVTRMPEAEYNRLLAQTREVVDRQIRDAYRDPAAAARVIAQTRAADAATREALRRPGTTYTPEGRAAIAAEGRRIEEKAAEVMRQLDRIEKDGKIDTAEMARLTELMGQLMADKIILRYRSTMIDPEQFNRTLEDMLRQGIIPETARDAYLTMRKMMEALPPGSPERIAEAEKLRRRMGESFIQLMVKEGQLTEEQADALRDIRQRVESLPSGDTRRKPLEAEISTAMTDMIRKRAAAEADKEKEWLRGLFRELTEGNAKAKKDAHEALKKWAGEMKALGERL